MLEASQNDQLMGPSCRIDARIDRNTIPLIIDRHISREIIRPFCTGLGLLVLIFIGFSAARQLNLAASGQLGMPAALKLISLNTLITLEILLPSAFFFSVLAAIGRLYRDSEMSALYAAGVSRARILQAVLKLALVVALITGLMSISGSPLGFSHQLCSSNRRPQRSLI